MQRTIWSLAFAVAALAITTQSASAGQFKKPIYYNVGTLSYSIVTADFNHDGNLDLAVSDWGADQISILLGKGDGSFHPARTFSVPSCTGLAVGDFNNDGKPDLAIVEYEGYGTGALGIYLGNATGLSEVGPATCWVAGQFGSRRLTSTETDISMSPWLTVGLIRTERTEASWCCSVEVMGPSKNRRPTSSVEGRSQLRRET